MTKLSVVIPVYNTEKYIIKCLDSIFNQRIEDIEVICVNDGSTDGSLKCLEEYKTKEPEKLIIINKGNEGSGVARNAGLETATGDYVLFVDSDDWLAEDVLSNLLYQAEYLNTDVLFFGAMICDKGRLRNGSYSVNKIPHKYKGKIFNKRYCGRDLFKFPSPAWSKLYKTKFLKDENIRFQEIKVGQDQIFFVKAMLCAKRIAVYDKNIYCYRKKRPGSVTSEKKKTTFSPIEVFYAIESLTKTEDENLRKFILEKYYKKALFWLPKVREDLREEYYDNYLKVEAHLKANYPKVCRNYFAVKLKEPYYGLKLKYFCSKFLFWRNW